MLRKLLRAGAVSSSLALVFTLSVAAIPATASTGPSINPQPVSKLKQGGTFVWAVNQMPDNFNTSHIDGNEVGASYIMGGALPAFFYVDAKGQLQVDKNYATSVSLVSSKPQIVSYVVNPKAKWSDGKAVGLADFVGQWKANNGSNEAYEVVSTTGYEDIKSVKKGKKPGEILVEFAKLYPDWKGLFGGLLPAAVTASPTAFNNSWKTAPNLSAGPFRYQGRDDVAKTVTMVRNPAWWGPKPVLDRIVYRALTVDTQLDALRNGEVDYIDIGPDANKFKQAKTLKNVRVDVSVAPNYRHMTFGTQSEFMKNVKVRQALTTAIDRATIARAMIGPMNPKIKSLDNHIFVAGTGCYKNNSGRFGKYNLQLADQLLDEAGWTLQGGVRKNASGQEMKLAITIPAGVATSAQEAQLIQSMYKPLGINLEIKVVPAAGFFGDYILPGAYDMTLFTWIGTIFPISSTKAILGTEGGQNFGKIGSTKIDKLLDQANSTLDEAQRCKLANQADALVWNVGHSAILYQRPNITAADSKLANIGAFGFSSLDYLKVGFVK